MNGRLFHKKANFKYAMLLFAVTLILFWKAILNPNFANRKVYKDKMMIVTEYILA